MESVKYKFFIPQHALSRRIVAGCPGECKKNNFEALLAGI